MARISTSYRIGQINREITLVNPDLPKLNSPEIDVSTNGVISIFNNLNGNFTSKYELYLDQSYIQDVPLDINDLKTINFPEIKDGNISIKALGNRFNTSDFSNSVFYKMPGYFVSQNDKGTTAKILSEYSEKEESIFFVNGTTITLI